jgi:hypothetical protein
MPLQEALEAIASLKPGEKYSYQGLAKKYGCCRSTLTRRVQGLHASRKDDIIRQQLLHPRTEIELVQYLRSLTERHLEPSRQMLIHIITPFCAWPPSESWITRFLQRHHDALENFWQSPMATVRHDADNYERYCLYFDLLHGKIEEHNVLPENTYNMDEKGFMIGVIKNGKRIFDKALFGKKQHQQSSHDGNREWFTVVAAVCADGTALPPCVIIPTPSSEVQQLWVQEIDPRYNSVHFTTSHNGWTNNDLGLAWLRDLFEPHTKPKSQAQKRLLILDGHASHITKDFMDYCDHHSILLFVLPPHATHTLQPLDVVCFKSLAQNYSDELANQHQRRQGKSPINKDDFSPLFIPAWEHTFTEKLVKKAFESTGIIPPDPDVILSKFKKSPPPTPHTPSEHSDPLEPKPARDLPS